MPRPRVLAALAAVVTVAHLGLVGQAMNDRFGDGAAESRPQRIEVAFVRELAPAEPLLVAAAAPVPRARPVAAAPAASAAATRPAPPPPEPPASAPEPELALAAQEEPPPTPAPLPVPEVPPTAPPAAGAAALSAASASGPATAAAPAAAASVPSGFEWPPSTRLSYRLSGNYRGPVDGQAQVEWLRSGTRYQVHMDLSIGPAFAPLMSRRVSSEGEITPAGLRPSRYDEETRVVLRAPRRVVVLLDADRVRLADGSEVARLPGVQDSASQFVQLTWLFTTQPALLRPGVEIEMPLALPRRMQTWTYEVLGAETLATLAGEVPALHVRPRREARPGGDLTAEMWVAPSLQYLPVRILIRQDEQTYLDLLVDRLPEQAAPGR